MAGRSPAPHDPPSDRPPDRPPDRPSARPTARPSTPPSTPPSARPFARPATLLAVLLLLLVPVALMGLLTGSEGLSWAALQRDLASGQARLLLVELRAPRTVGAALVGALLGLGGSLSQGIFRNPLADPYLLGSAAGASLGVVVVLAAGGLSGWLIAAATTDLVQRIGLVGAAFGGALLGVSLTVLLARGAHDTLRLLLAGIVVGVLLTAFNELLTTLSVDALRGRQQFLLGSTALIGWPVVAVLAIGLLLALAVAAATARVLDALTLGEDGAASLGLALNRWRLALLALMALCTGLAVAHAGLIAFVGLVAPHLVRRLAPSAHRMRLFNGAAAGAVLLLTADVLARALLAPRELPVGIVTALLGGGYLVWLLHRRPEVR